MKEYRVKYDTVIEGRHAKEGEKLMLADDKAKIYAGAGLIEEAGMTGTEAEKAAAKKKD